MPGVVVHNLHVLDLEVQAGTSSHLLVKIGFVGFLSSCEFGLCEYEYATVRVIMFKPEELVTC